MICTPRLNDSNDILHKYCLVFDKHLLNTNMSNGAEPPQQTHSQIEFPVIQLGIPFI